MIELDGKVYTIIGVNNDKKNAIELNLPDIKYTEFCEMNNIKSTPRIFKTIGRKVESIRKLSTDVLGNRYYQSCAEKPQLIFKKGI